MMPTGYTAAVQDGISFEEFVWRCARGMGALIMMRDDPLDAPIPERFEPHDYNARQLETAKARLAELRKMSDVDATIAAQDDYQKELDYKAKVDAKDADSAAKYDAMIARVNEWEPPTSEHAGLKKFMLDQLHESKRFDCGYTREMPVLLTGDEWRARAIEKALRDVSYHAEEQEKEVERTEARNKWIAALRESVNVPAR